MGEVRDFEPLPDAQLNSALRELYAHEAAELPGDLWMHLDSAARQHAERRRMQTLARRLLFALGPLRVGALVVIAAMLCGGAILLAHVDGRTTSQAVEVTGARATLTGSGGAPVIRKLRNGTIVQVMGDVAIEQQPGGAVRIALKSGAIHATVPKLPSAQPFVVVTSTAEVTADGTRFSVQESPAGDSNVAVEEGLAKVRPIDGRRPSFLLHAGETATVEPFADYLARMNAVVGAAVRAEACGEAESTVRRYVAEASSSVDVSAAEYLLGACAAQRGELEEALKHFESAASIPSERADNALARIAQIREKAGDGTSAWRRYLESYPNGLHADLARRFLRLNEHRSRL